MRFARPYFRSTAYDPQVAFFGAGLCYLSYYGQDPWVDTLRGQYDAESVTLYPLTNLLVPRMLVMKTPDGCAIAIEGTSNVPQSLSYIVNAGLASVQHCQGHAFSPFELCAEACYLQILTSVPMTYPLFITGHSLGGAVAQLLAKKLANHGYTVSNIYTYGTPRAVDADCWNDYELPSWSVRNITDPIPYLPHPALSITLNPLTGSPYLPVIYGLGDAVYIGNPRREPNYWTWLVPGAPLLYVTKMTLSVMEPHLIANYVLGIAPTLSIPNQPGMMPMITALNGVGFRLPGLTLRQRA